ncbi:MAG: YceI family protein [Myxococcota bacterium]
MRAALFVLCLLAPAGAWGAAPQAPLPQHLVLDPGACHVGFELGATLHSVEGSFRLTRGEIGFDPETGLADGRVVVSARSGTTGIGLRDRNMHRAVLESETYPEIVFLPQRVAIQRHRDDVLDVELSGSIEIHGVSEPITVPGKAYLEDGRVRVHARFEVPYVRWGLRDYSNFLLRVSPTVEVSLDLVGDLKGPAPP